MKKLLFCLLIALCSCVSKKPITVTEPEIMLPDTVTVVVEDTARISELTEKIKSLEDTLRFYKDSIPYDVYINARRIEKIKYYIRITEKNPNNQKFFYGLIRRTMNEE